MTSAPDNSRAGALPHDSRHDLLHDLRGLPIDPDLDELDARERRPPAGSHLGPRVLAAVFVGGVLGGLARYAIGYAASPSADAFPWDVFAVNLSGAFALALLLVLALEVLRPMRYLRPALGTGFLGSFTTFSSLATGADHLLAHGRPGLAVAYAVGSIVGGLASASFGLVVGRAIAVNRERAHVAAVGGRSGGLGPRGRPADAVEEASS